ncbi:MAG: hypothetical protein HQL06_15375 [Nitrospirae bacterium]|nr:hypothetical protein [Nitrospirota bacterium]
MEEDTDNYHIKKGREAGLYLAGFLSAIRPLQTVDITINVNLNPIDYSKIGFELPVTFERFD